MIPHKKILSMFAVFKTKRTKYIFKRIGIFLCPFLNAVICKDKEAVGLLMAIPTLRVCVVRLVAKGERQPFSILNIQISFIKMTKRNEICNTVNNSICTATSAHETCTPSSEVRIFKDCSFSTFEKFLSCIKSEPKEDPQGTLRIISGADYREVSFISPEGTLTLQMKKGGIS
jgi:hypothetical protein